MISILIVENNSELMEQERAALEEMGYMCVTATGARKAGAIAEERHIDFVVGNMDAGACNLCHRLRSKGNIIPFLVLIDDFSKSRRRQAFRSGADGYLSLPLDTEELQMYTRNLLWRCGIIEGNTSFTFGDCTLDSSSYTVTSPEKTVTLRRLEFLLLEKLLSYPGRAFTRNQLLDELWGYDCESEPRTVDTHIKRLRKQLKGIETIKIQTIRGLGYRAAVAKKYR